MITWLQARSKMWTVDLPFRQNVQVNIDTIMKRIETMGCKIEHEQVCNKAAYTSTARLLSSGQEQPKQPSSILTVCYGYHHQPRWLCRRSHKPHEDDRDLFSLVLIPLFLFSFYYL